jgi:hypothetical protein
MSTGRQPLGTTGSATSQDIGHRRSLDVLSRAEAAIASPLISFGLILALQLRVIWNVWQYKDLTPGDSAGYFLDASGWAHGLHDDIVWSPLYTDVWGTVLAIAKDNVYAAEMFMRVGSILAATLLVLALARRLLRPAVALLVAAWWAIVPANYNVLYEVHLFGALPILVAALVVARMPNRRSLGIALALLVGSTLLLRNELSIATVIVAAAILVYELRQRRKRAEPAATYVRSYGIPLAIVVVLAGGMYWRSHVQGSELRPVINTKHDLNMCQVYAFNFQQQHPTRFRGDAFTECAPLMRQTFGRPMPSLLQATVANPRAIAGFVKWNLQLFPSGAQVALFGATSTADQPDYPPVDTRESYALVLSLLVLALLFGGLLVIKRDHSFRHAKPLLRHGWAVVVLGAVALTTVVVVLTQRPRPEYMYGLTIGLMLLAGASVSALLRWRGWMRYAPAGASVVTLALVIALPSYYHRDPRPLHDAVERLHLVRQTLQRPGGVLVAANFNLEICSYLSASFNRSCSGPSWASLQAQLAAGTPIRQVLDRAKANVIYADALLLENPSVADLVAGPQRYGWRQVAGGVGEAGPWRILVRAT